MRMYSQEEIEKINYILGKDKNNKYFTENEVQAIDRINLSNDKVTKVCKTIYKNERGDNNMNDIMIFKNEDFGEIRSLEINSEPYFVGKDIAETLMYREPHKAIVNHIDKDDRIKYPIIDELGRKQDTWLINESGLYSLIMSSKLPKAKLFKRWVTSEVLPSIRKHGKYELDTNGLMKQLTQSQITLNNVLAGFKMQIDNDLIQTNIKVCEHDELLKKRVYLSPKEAKDVQKGIKLKAKQIAMENKLPYHKIKGKLFKRLYTALNETFEVATYRELPSIYFDDITQVIKCLTIYIRDLKEEQYQISL